MPAALRFFWYSPDSRNYFPAVLLFLPIQYTAAAALRNYGHLFGAVQLTVIKYVNYYSEFLDISKGDRVALMMENRPESIFSFFSIWAKKGIGGADERELEKIYYFEIAPSPAGDPGFGLHRTYASKDVFGYP